MKRLDGKTAVVTGASSGIGRAIVERFVAEGAKVFAFARNAEALKALEAAHPGQVIAVSGDVTRQEDLKQLVETVVKHAGAIDILVPNAGIARVVSFDDSTAEAFSEQFSVNLFGAAETARLFVPHIRQGGSIQFITTFLTQVGFPGLAIYSASKAALKSLSQTLASGTLISGRLCRTSQVSCIHAESRRKTRQSLHFHLWICFRRIVQDNRRHNDVWLSNDCPAV